MHGADGHLVQGSCPPHRHLALQVEQASADLLRQTGAAPPPDTNATSSLARRQSAEGGGGDVQALLDLRKREAVVVQVRRLSQRLCVNPLSSTEPVPLARGDAPGDLDTFARVGGLGVLDEAEQERAS
jgi:hypothetical protein